ncbi:MAG: T9SS type A sorting domain-containing protein [Candidatus Saganbacteria bacterium]|nr:T9SS type A sorting domain-containing protein [Candidatus Saganbacteria bacterium]
MGSVLVVICLIGFLSANPNGLQQGLIKERGVSCSPPQNFVTSQVDQDDWEESEIPLQNNVFSVMTATVSGSQTVSLSNTPINYPNPFSPSDGQSTTMRYTLSEAAPITIKIYNIAGRPVRSNFYLAGTPGGSEGINEVTWDGSNDFGGKVANGAYIYFVTSRYGVLGSGQMAILN